MSELRTDLKAGLKGKSHTAILKAMGYRNPTPANIKRLENVLASKHLGLEGGGFDLKYSSAEFLLALSKVAGLKGQEARHRISHLEHPLSEEWHAFKPYLWVDTNFKRTSQPIFALAACESFRHLFFPKGFWRLPLEQQLAKAGEKIREHVRETTGTLGIWGKIEAYWFVPAPGQAYVLSTEGDVIGEKHFATCKQ